MDMNYHNITIDDMLNGDGLRVVLWVAGCEHHCVDCQNPVTWNPEDGLTYDHSAWSEICTELKKDYISGITLSGGDPLHPNNRKTALAIAFTVKFLFPTKTVWLYTGYLWEEVKDLAGMEYVDVLVDGRFIKVLADTQYHWAGSTNQRVIDVKKSLECGYVVRHDSCTKRRKD